MFALHELVGLIPSSPVYGAAAEILSHAIEALEHSLHVEDCFVALDRIKLS